MRGLAGQRGARRVRGLHALRAGGGAGGLAVDDHVLREQSPHVGAGRRNGLAGLGGVVHAAAPSVLVMYFDQAANWLRITTSEVPWFE